MNKFFTQFVSLMIMGLLPISVFAHSGMEVSGFIAGILHPLTGFDHLLAILAVGLWASQMGNKSLWTLPSTFVVVMVLAALLPAIGIAIPYVETGILLSILVFGGLVAAALPMSLSIVIVGCFALFHGYAHGAEASVISATYIAGFALSTSALLASGVGLGMSLRQLNVEKITRFAGGMIAMTGMYLVFA